MQTRNVTYIETVEEMVGFCQALQSSGTYKIGTAPLTNSEVQ